MFVQRNKPLKKVSIVSLLVALLFVATMFLTSKDASANPSFLDWDDWYPLDRGQAAGERALNWWATENGNYIQGQSTYRYPAGTPSNLPSGRTYYLNWFCKESKDRTTSPEPDCKYPFGSGPDNYSEILSIKNDIILELWGHGTGDWWLTFYSQHAFVDNNGQFNCTKEAAQQASNARRSGPDYRSPLVWRLPAQIGKPYAYNGSVACTVIYDDYGTASNKIQKAHYQWIKNWQDNSNDPDIIKAIGDYYKSYTSLENDCWKDGEGKYITETVPVLTVVSPGPVFRDIETCVYKRETYYMRRVPEGNELKNGFGYLNLVGPGENDETIATDHNWNGNENDWIIESISIGNPNWHTSCPQPAAYSTAQCGP